MDKKKISGYWVLKSRIEDPEQESSIKLCERSYKVFIPPLEFLYFNTINNNCFHLGIEEIPEEDRLIENGGVIKYDATSLLPGYYNSENYSINILGIGVMTLVDGNLHITEKSDDYYCEEIWTRLSQEYNEMKSFIESIVHQELSRIAEMKN